MRRWTWPQMRMGPMLDQVRLLFLVFCGIWAIIALAGIQANDHVSWPVPALAVLLVEASLFSSYRRRRVSWLNWVVEAPCVAVVAAGSSYGITLGLLIVWINFRALYGNLKDQLIGATAVIFILGIGVTFAGMTSANAVSIAVTALIGLAINFNLAQGIRARDRAAVRESVVAAAGASFAAVTTRQEAAQAAATAAAHIDEDVSSALVTTIAGRSARVIGHAGAAGPEVLGSSMDLDVFGADMQNALRPGGSALITGEAAEAFATLVGTPPQSLLVVPLAVHGTVFGLLVVSFHRRPVDDLTVALSTLADEAAMTLDQLLSQSRLSIVVTNLPDALILASERGVIRSANPATGRLLGCAADGLIGSNVRRLVHPEDADTALAPESVGARTCRLRGHDDLPWTEFEVLVKYVVEHDGSRSLIFNARDISERQRLELELRHAQKLESVGRLAAGVAHEINTPIQFVGDNVRFVEESFAELTGLLAACRELTFDPADPTVAQGGIERIRSLCEQADVGYLLDEVPVAVRQTLEGVDRVATIVRAMKAFGHPGTVEKTLADLNELIANTLVVAAGEIKYVADVETDLADLPLLRCHVGDINQILLNLVVNAAHAIDSAGRGRGTIRVTTCQDGDEVVIEVADTGTGVPPEVAEKLFDPFFTTKEVGRGTGQGLPLARSLVVDRHRGSIGFRSEVNVGSVFTVRLPMNVEDPVTFPTVQMEVAV